MKSLHATYSGLTIDYDELYKHYNTLRGQYSNLRAKFNAVLADSPKATEERRQLVIVQAALEEQKKLKEEAEERLTQAHDEIRRFGKDFRQEATENEELKAIIATQNQTISDYQKENAEHEAENIAAKTLITQLEKLQDLCGENHALAMKDLQEENNNLDIALQEAITIKDIRAQAEESLKMDMGKLQQKCRLQTQQLLTIKEALAPWYPDLHDNFDNITAVLGGGLEGKSRKRRKQT
ncbi:hypothetical protein S40288_10403 [Stachybotrys chartarum IBT 40288]|nr:hypothetical protein S40288_10403 [Stachybotrys chartarum IBT 40288]